MTRRDSIVEEVRKHRAQIAREHSHDVEAIVAALEGEDPSEPTPLVSFPPKRLPKRPASAQRRARQQINKALETARS